MGVVFYELIYGYCPYQGATSVQIYKKSKNPPDFNGVNISPAARDFIKRCLTFDQKDRMSWDEVFNHELVKEKIEPFNKIYNLCIVDRKGNGMG